MKGLSCAVLIVLLSTVLCAAHAAPSELPAGLVPDGYSSSERQSFNLGGPSGTYTDWNRYDLAPFTGLATVLEIPAVHGKPKDKWAAVAKIRLVAAGDSKPVSLDLSFVVDRKTGRVHPRIQQGETTAPIEVEFGLKQSVPVVIVWKSPGVLDVRIADSHVDVSVPFEINRIALAGSGLDVLFSPFVLLSRPEGRD